MSPEMRNAFFRQASLSVGHAASSTEPFTKLTCGRVVTFDATSGRLASKSTPTHVFESDSPRADREKPQAKTASPRRNERYRRERPATPSMFFMPSSFAYSDRRWCKNGSAGLFSSKLLT